MQAAAGPHRVRRRSLVHPAMQEEIVSTIRSVLAHLSEVARAEKIPLRSVIASVILVCLKHRDIFMKRSRRPNDDILRQIGLEVRTTAKRLYREDLAADARHGKKPARAAPRRIANASAAATGPAGDPEPVAKSVGRKARSSGGRPARSASPRGLARKPRRDDGR